MSRIHTSVIPAETGNPSPRIGAVGATAPGGMSHNVPVMSPNVSPMSPKCLANVTQMSRSWHIFKDRPKAESPGMSHIASGVKEF